MVGFFRELEHGDDEASSLLESVGDKNLENEKEIVGYLKSGTVLHITPGLVQDMMEPSRNSIIDSLYTLTDGVWCWPSDLPYYVETYHVKMPDLFLFHMKSCNWQPATNINLDSLEDVTPVFF